MVSVALSSIPKGSITLTRKHANLSLFVGFNYVHCAHYIPYFCRVDALLQSLEPHASAGRTGHVWYARVLLLFSASVTTDTGSKAFDCALVSTLET